jgi:hypothetical protein
MPPQLPGGDVGALLGARALAALGDNSAAFNLWADRHPYAVAHGEIPGWAAAAGAAGRKHPALAAAAAGGVAADLAGLAHQLPGGVGLPGHFPIPTAPQRRQMISPLARAAIGY